MAATNRPWCRHGKNIELLAALLTETWEILREPLLTSGDPSHKIEENPFNGWEQEKLESISNFAQRFLVSTKQPRLLARIDARLKNPDDDDDDKPLPQTNYDKLQSALEAIDTVCQEIATDFIRNSISERITTLRNHVREVESLAAGELATEKLRAQHKKADQRPGLSMTLEDTVEVLGRPLEVDPAFCQAPAQLQQQDNDTSLGGHDEPLSAERHRPRTPPKRKWPQSLLSPGLTTRMYKRPSREALSTAAADNTQQHFKGEDVWREEKRDGEGAGDLDPEGRARYFATFSGIVHMLKPESSAGKASCEDYLMMILLPSRVAQGRLDAFEGLKALPLGGKEWSCCWVLEKEIEPSSSDWGRLKQLPGAHVVRVLQADLGPHNSGERAYHEVAICNSYRHHLLSNGFQLEAISIDPDMWIARSNKEIREHGMQDAEQTVAKRAEDYLQCALKALESGLGPGLDQFYRRFAPSGLRITVEWIILMRQLLVLPPPPNFTALSLTMKTAGDEEFRRFAQCCVALGLSLLEDMEGPAAEELFMTGLESWRKFFRSMLDDRLKWPPGSRTVELHDIAVLHCIMKHSGFEMDPEPLQQCFDDACSNEEKLDRLGLLLDLGTRPHNGSNEAIVSEVFLRAQVWEEGAWENVRALVLLLVPGCSEGR